MTKSRNLLNTLIITALAGAVATVFALKHGRKTHETSPMAAVALSDATAMRRPALVDLGAGKCIPCKMMAPILDELKVEYADRFSTTFYDVWEDPEPGKKFGVRIIPTQIFLDPDGQELFRHEGFFGKEDILAKWKEYGVTVATESKQ